MFVSGYEFFALVSEISRLETEPELTENVMARGIEDGRGSAP